MKISKCMQEAMTCLGFKTLRKHQTKPISSILNKQDIFAVYPTGSGKSAIYQIPALMERGRLTIVIEPTVSLMVDQVRALQARGVMAEYLSAGNHQLHPQILEQITDRQLTILYITPERLQTSQFRIAIQKNPPWLVAVDEAHCVLDWGFTFRTSYLQIKKFIASLTHRPVVVALTATAPPEYRRVLCKLLGLVDPENYTHSLNRPNILLLKEDCVNLELTKRLKRVKSYINKYMGGEAAVVYCATRRNVDLVTNYLSAQFPGNVVKCHAYMDEEKRVRNELSFVNGKKRIMVATTAFGMGVDVANIRLVIHFNLPLSIVDYYQQIGRAGRDGKPSHAVLLYHPDDISLNHSIVNQYKVPSVQDWLMERTEEMAALAESGDCLMQQTLSALGEVHPKTCKHCTNCQRTRRGQS